MKCEMCKYVCIHYYFSYYYTITNIQALFISVYTFLLQLIFLAFDSKIPAQAQVSDFFLSTRPLSFYSQQANLPNLTILGNIGFFL